eukprot:2070989-Prymnesium_polylepis.2
MQRVRSLCASSRCGTPVSPTSMIVKLLLRALRRVSDLSCRLSVSVTRGAYGTGVLCQLCRVCRRGACESLMRRPDQIPT